MANSLLCSQCMAYMLAMFFAFLVVVPLAQNGNDFKGRCLLYAQGSWRRPNDTAPPVQHLPPPSPPPPAPAVILRRSRTDEGITEQPEQPEQPEQDGQDGEDYDIDRWVNGEPGTKVTAGGAHQRLSSSSERGDGVDATFVLAAWGAPPACQFATFSGIVSMLLAAAQACRSLFHQCTGRDDAPLAAFASLAASALTATLMFAAGTVVSVGFNAWCSSIADASISKTPSCEEAQEMNLNLDAVTTSFYTHFGVIQFGLWSAWLTWVALAGLAFAKVHRSREQFDLDLLREKEVLFGRALTTASAGVTSAAERQAAAPARATRPSAFI